MAIENAFTPMLMVGRDARAIWANKAYCTLVGMPIEQVINAIPSSLKNTRENPEFHRNLWHNVFAGIAWTGELTEANTKSSSKHYMEAIITPLMDANGHPSQFLIIERDITSHKAQRDQMWHIAYHDSLTGLPNRMLFSNLLAQGVLGAQRAKAQVGLLFIDLDKFKAANDTYGHHVGDMVLIEVGKRLQAVVRQSDVVSRFAGDEFGAILGNVGDITYAEAVAAKIVEAICQPMQLDGNCVRVGVSIGVAIYPNDGLTPDILLRNADTAMYAAKHDGRNCFRTFQRLPTETKAQTEAALTT